MTKEVKVVFLQADKENHSNLSKMLDGLQQKEYFFLIVSQDVNVMTREQVQRMLDSIPTNN